LYSIYHRLEKYTKNKNSIRGVGGRGCDGAAAPGAEPKGQQSGQQN